MKTKVSILHLIPYVLFLLTLCPSPSALSQVPKGFNYQAIVRDGTTKQPIISQPILVRITIENAAETAVYQETHSLSTDEFGIMAIVIGDGTPAGTDLFEDIDWNEEPLFIKTELQYPVGGSYTEMGTAPLLSVPYAMVADSLSAPLTKLTVKGETTDMEEALFEVRNKDGQTIFAVYNEGVRVYVSDGDKKGPKGGFAIGGFGGDKQGVQKYFFVSPDSIRAYIDSTSTKAVKGGFAIGGFENTKAPGQEYLRVTRDSVRVYLDANPATKAVKGGFAIGGFDINKKGEPVQNYLDVTPSTTKIMTADTVKGFSVGNILTGTAEGYLKLTPANYFIGHEAGKIRTTGLYNSIMGYQAGASLTTAKNTVLMGFQSGRNISTGLNNSFLGYQSGFSTTNGCSNVFLGTSAGYKNSSGSQNVFIGDAAGYNNESGNQNVFIGLMAGYSAKKLVGRSTFIGFQAGLNSNSGYNTLIGAQAGANLTTASGNTFIGYHAGVTTYAGSWNVCIGMKAGGATDEVCCNELGDGNVYIGTAAGEKHGGNSNTFIGSGAGGYKYWASYLTSSGNVFLGHEAGYQETGSNKLYIDNSNSSSPLIYGDFTDNSEVLVLNGNVGIKITPSHLIHLSGGAYSDGSIWTNSSDRNLKENFEAVDGKKLLSLIDELPVMKWNYLADNPEIKHIGPVAQDFYSLFGLGNNNTSISTVDPAGVALVAIKELSRQNMSMMEQIESQSQENQQLKSELQSIKNELTKIKEMLGKR
jgi:hypothetical protein